MQGRGRSLRTLARLRVCSNTQLFLTWSRSANWSGVSKSPGVRIGLLFMPLPHGSIQGALRVFQTRHWRGPVPQLSAVPSQCAAFASQEMLLLLAFALVSVFFPSGIEARRERAILASGVVLLFSCSFVRLFCKQFPKVPFFSAEFGLSGRTRIDTLVYLFWTPWNCLARPSLDNSELLGIQDKEREAVAMTLHANVAIYD
jgi:hypothetical protein